MFDNKNNDELVENITLVENYLDLLASMLSAKTEISQGSLVEMAQTARKLQQVVENSLMYAEKRFDEQCEYL